jgi:hypothetical protein
MKLMEYLIKMMTKNRGGNQLKPLALIFFTCLKRAFSEPLSISSTEKKGLRFSS